MIKRFAMLLLASIIVLLSGCLGSTAQYPDVKLPDEIPSDKEVVKELEQSKISTSTSKQDEDILELKHWKYGSERSADTREKVKTAEEYRNIRPTSYLDGAEDYSKVVSIQILTEEEMQEIIKILLDSGYLKEEVCTKEEFEKALLDFQNACGLKTTGQPDAETLKQIKLIEQKSGN